MASSSVVILSAAGTLHPSMLQINKPYGVLIDTPRCASVIKGKKKSLIMEECN